MGWFFKSKTEKIIGDVLENCDFKFMRAMVRAYYNEGIMERSLVSTLDAFDKNPCRKTASNLIKYDLEHFGTMFAGGHLIKDSIIFEGGNPYDPNNIQDHIAETTGQEVGNKERRTEKAMEEIVAAHEKAEKEAIKTRNEKELDKMFAQCDFVFANGLLHAEFDGSSDEDFGQVDDKNLVLCLRAYDKDPCRENALKLLERYYDNINVHQAFLGTADHVKGELEELGADVHSVPSVKAVYWKYIESLDTSFDEGF